MTYTIYQVGAGSKANYVVDNLNMFSSEGYKVISGNLNKDGSGCFILSEPE